MVKKNAIKFFGGILFTLIICSCINSKTYSKITLDKYVFELESDSTSLKFEGVLYGLTRNEGYSIRLEDSTWVDYSIENDSNIHISTIRSKKTNLIDTAKVEDCVTALVKLAHKHSIISVHSKRDYQLISFKIDNIEIPEVKEGRFGVLVFCHESSDSVLLKPEISYYSPRLLKKDILFYEYR